MKRKLLLSTILFIVAVTALYAQPAITLFSPATGPVGTLVTITGTNLGSPTLFNIGGKAALVISNTGTQLVGYVMPGSATGPISISTAGGSVNSTGNFTITATPFPSVQEGSPITSATNYGQAEIGSSVAISADGSTVILGGPYYYSGSGINPGVALIYAYNNGNWTQQAEFSASNYSPQQGRSVALSADGNTAMVGGSGDDSTSAGYTGAVWFYTRSGTTWTEQGLPVIGTGSVPYPGQGFSCALSADGNTAIEGGSGDNNSIGAAWIFTRSGGVWTQQGGKLVPSDYAGQSYFGSSIALSADGNTAVIGGNNDGSIVVSNQQYTQGATWVFTRTGTTWAQQGSKIIATGGNADDYQGTSVGVSADGNTLITGGPQTNSVWVFTRSGGTWTQLGSPFAPTGITGNAGEGDQTGFGNAVALSADGNTAIVGDNLNGTFDGPGPGGTWVFTRSGNTYIQQEGPLLGAASGTSPYEGQGNAVALSANGAAAIVGGSVNGTNFQGAGWVFITPLPAQTITFKPLANVVYGSADVSPGATSSTSATNPITYSSNNAAVATISGSGNIHIVGAGTATITAMEAGNASYSAATPVSQTFTVTPAALTVTANSISSQDGAPLPVLTAKYNGFVYSDNAASLTTPPTVTTTATSTSPIGTYPITASGAADANYNIGYVQGVLSVVISTNANLSFLSISNHVPLSPVFAPATTGYTASVPYTTSSITLAPTVADANATVTVDGTAVTSGTFSQSIPLVIGSNTVSTTVTAQNGAMLTYTVVITRLPSSIATLSNLTVSAGGLSPGFGSAKTSYTTLVSGATTAITLTPTTTDPNATVTVNGAMVTSGSPSGAIALSVGGNTITTIVTAPDKSTTDTYTVTVTRQPSSNAYLSFLSISNHVPLSPAFAETTTGYTASVPNTTSSVTLDPTTADPTATVTVAGMAVTSATASQSIPLTVGNNSINTTVTAQDGTMLTYTVVVTRAPSSVATLSNLTLSNGGMSPGFGSAKTSYTAVVGSTVTSITETPTTTDPTATVTVNGMMVTSGSPSAAIALSTGSNTITTIVTAGDKSTTDTYTVTVTRQPSSNAKLSFLGLSQVVLSPAFNTATTSYTASVPNTLTSTNVLPIAVDATATIAVNGVAVASGSSTPVALNAGANVINTVVTAQDGTMLTYTVTVTVAAPTAAFVVYDPVSVEKPTDSPQLADDGIVVHQGVSPNGDGIDDVLTIDGITNYPDNKLMIINRSGMLIYDTKGYDNSSRVFDGHSNKNGQMQLPGTYFFSLDYTVNGTIKHRTGYIVLKY